MKYGSPLFYIEGNRELSAVAARELYKQAFDYMNSGLDEDKLTFIQWAQASGMLFVIFNLFIIFSYIVSMVDIAPFIQPTPHVHEVFAKNSFLASFADDNLFSELVTDDVPEDQGMLITDPFETHGWVCMYCLILLLISC